MNTYDYMYSVLGLRGTIEITTEQLMRLRDEGVSFVGGFVCYDRDDLTLKCQEAMKLEEEISNAICNGGRDAKQVMYITNPWKWRYLVEEYTADDIDGGIHFTNLTVYYKEVEEDDN